MKKNFASLAMLFIWFSILTGCVSSPKVQKEVVFTEVSVSECYFFFTVLALCLSHNVPRIGEVGRRPIWVKRSGTAYSLLYDVF